MSRLWDKGLPLDERVLRYTAGEDHRLDARLVEYDVRASIAHAEMLCERQLLTQEDCTAIRDGLQKLDAAFRAGEWQIALEDEDVHTALENRLAGLIGAAGERLHLGRSRNDQVLAALRLYLLDAADQVCDGLGELCAALGGLGQREAATALPGYTHMQQAMPSSVPLWSAAFVAAFRDDMAGVDATRRRVSQNPLGSAAGYGTPGLTLDRDATTAKLGFAQTQSPVTAVQLSRGKAECSLLFELTLVMQDLSRLASDLLLFYTEEFRYIELASDVTTGSSIMPQKRNPDVLELVRAAAATAQAGLGECLMISAKLPSGYQRDLQRLKAPLFRTIDLTIESVEVMSCVIGGLRFLPQNIRFSAGIDAAEQANRLVVAEGLPFREAYRRVAEAWRTR